MLDEAIMNMITHEDISQTLLCKIAQETSFGLCHALQVHESVRNAEINAKSVAHENLAKLESLAKCNQLNVREMHLAASALQCAMKNFGNAGTILESCLLYFPMDALVLRLAFEAHVNSGNSFHAMLCIARSLQVFDDRHFLHGHLLGILAAGYLEVGNMTSAEDNAARAVEKTKGRDIWALHTLANVFQMSGRSSESLELLNRHMDKHTAPGSLLLVFNKGCALIQRGNYTGALRAYDELIDRMSTEEERHTVKSLTDATLLLWSISITQGMTAELAMRWNSSCLCSKWQLVATGAVDLLPLQEVALSMCLGHAACPCPCPSSLTSSSALQQPAAPIETKNNEQVSGPSSSSKFLSWVRGGSSTGKTLLAASAAHAAVALAPHSWSTDPADILKYRMIRMCTDKAKSLEQECPTLAAFTPRVCLQRPDRTQSPLNHTQHPLAIVVDAVTSFIAGRTAQASDALLQGAACTQLTLLQQLGGTAVQRDVLQQTIIEGYVRADRLDEAKMLLCERTALSPNDAQAWRKLSAVFARCGQTEMAESARYTSWQLGIGQGGFGGPR